MALFMFANWYMYMYVLLVNSSTQMPYKNAIFYLFGFYVTYVNFR